MKDHIGEKQRSTSHWKDFPFNATSIGQLPSGQQKALRKAAAFALKEDTWIDILGHSDTVGSESAKKSVSENRARAVQHFLMREGLGYYIQEHDLIAERYTRVEGRSDHDALEVKGAIIGAPDRRLRRVQIILSTRPAGAQNPVSVTPKVVDEVGPEKPEKVTDILENGNPCEKLLVGVAWKKK